MTAHSDDKFEAVIYRQYMKDGLYKYGENFDNDAFWEMMQYIITKYCCCYDECDHKCEECEYGIIISEYENKIKETNEEDDTESEYDCENCPQKDDCIFQKWCFPNGKHNAEGGCYIKIAVGYFDMWQA